MADRPGDLLVLARYWREKGQLGALTEMMDFSVDARLVEDSRRPDADKLPEARAREGAERIAAAMVLGGKLTVRLSDSGPGDGLSLRAVLEDWAPADRRALIRRGVFAAATYGQARFHHRSLMEYLAARWFARMLDNGCPEARILAVMTARPFGVLMTPPSLRPTAAWLGPHCPALLQHLRRCEPLALILHGDPTALPVAVRGDLLRRYAELHREGAVKRDYADEHALWMFADPALGPALNDAWRIEPNPHFRFELLRLVDQGAIQDGTSLAEETALDEPAPIANRIAAARALAKLGAWAELTALADQMAVAPSAFGPRLAPDLAICLFPKVITVEGLLHLMRETPPAHSYQVEGFGYYLDKLYAACPSEAAREVFIDGVADLCLAKPVDAQTGLSLRHKTLAGKIASTSRVRRSRLRSGAIRSLASCGCFGRRSRRTRIPTGSCARESPIRSTRGQH